MLHVHHLRCLLVFLLCASASSLVAQDIDVFFVTGQSNATNLFESSGADGVSGNEESQGRGRATIDVGFNLEFARIGDRTSRDSDISDIVRDSVDRPQFSINFQPNFSSNLLNDDLATTTLAVGLHRNNDMAIYGYARGGRPLANTGTSGESWYPGSNLTDSDPSNDVRYDDELYGSFISWSNDRLAALEAQGFNPIVRGIFWFQGEADVGAQTTGEYQENYENLIARFREDFGPDVVVVASDIIVRNPSNGAGQREQEVNDALAAVAANDPLVGVTPVDDLAQQNNSANNVHLDKGFNSSVGNSNQYDIVAQRWFTEYNTIVAALVPAVTSVEVNGGEDQRSAIETLTVEFDKDVTLQDGAISVVQRSTATAETFEDVTINVTEQTINGQKFATIQFESHVRNSDNALEDGNYQLNINANLVLNRGIPMVENFVVGDAEADGLFSFYGDSDGNRSLNVIDLLVFRNTYLKFTGDAAYQFFMDFDANGVVNVLDLLSFRNRYLTTLPFSFGSSLRTITGEGTTPPR